MHIPDDLRIAEINALISAAHVAVSGAYDRAPVSARLVAGDALTRLAFGLWAGRVTNAQFWAHVRTVHAGLMAASPNGDIVTPRVSVTPHPRRHAAIKAVKGGRA